MGLFLRADLVSNKVERERDRERERQTETETETERERAKVYNSRSDLVM